MYILLSHIEYIDILSCSIEIVKLINKTGDKEDESYLSKLLKSHDRLL